MDPLRAVAAHRFRPRHVCQPAMTSPAHRTATHTPPAAADTGTPARPRRTVTDGTADSVAIHRPAQQEFNAHRTATHDDEGTGR